MVRDRFGPGESVRALVELAVPLRCAGCARHGAVLCAHCDGEFGRLRRVRPGLLAESPPVYALGRYRGGARRAVLAYKEFGRRDLVRPLGDRLARAVGTVRGECAEFPDEGPFRMVPVPSRPAAVRARGGAHLVRLAHRAARCLGEDAVVDDRLRLSRVSRDSVGLDATRRLHNIRRGLRVRAPRAPRRGEPVVVVDDVVTTGATVSCCVDALGADGTRVVAVVVLAAARQ
ncbi:ComF family protein [Actinopolyspora mortivallis]|uniref:Amidophosphoribosyltransferase n=1 Tax=Actinopolyspora mortivallis TaxID=33906 RepID=A0A2T0GUB3_ACTMO|nr:ComF family protein [Actinopolyspora mortivallis]PRW62690.1 hypothetical protein CEP50_14370 [Actinopolyspora mortivallis]